MSLARRAVTAAVAVPLAVSCLAAPDTLFGTFVGAVAAVCVSELRAMADRRLPPRSHVLRLLPVAVAVVSVAVTAGVGGGQAVPGDRTLLLVFSGGLAILCGMLLFSWGHQGAGSAAVAWFTVDVCGFALVVMPLCFGCALRRWAPQGKYLLLATTACVWNADNGALFAGRLFPDSPLLASHISPGKTWAGVGGSVAGSVATALVLPLLGLAPLLEGAGSPLGSPAASQGVASPHLGLALAATIGLLCVAGDLVESVAKRWAGVKDSGGLLPGHGGLLDRVDSSLLVYVLVYLLRS